jgi:peptidoglycan/LPS O-acetylase OafA/YrhL
MRSSNGSYYVGLDHLRGLAAFMVFTWHFLHGSAGYPLPFGNSPAFFPAAVLDEGHVGVALFMTLSGYLFTKLLDGKTVHFSAFLWNRFLRLFPLLALLVWLDVGGNGLDFIQVFAVGAVFPVLPHGGWSVTVESHFYLILPLLIFFLRKNPLILTAVIGVAFCVRFVILQVTGEVQTASYWTIIGRIDQFTLGMIFYSYRVWFTKRHLAMIIVGLSFTFFYYLFDAAGGYCGFGSHPCGFGSQPSQSSLWLFLPTIEGAFFGILIAYYDTSFSFKNAGVSWLFAQIGAYSYSIYLLQSCGMDRISNFFNNHVWPINNIYVGILGSCISFLAFLPIAALSYHLIEKPFLRFRRKYVSALHVSDQTSRPASKLNQSAAI